VQGWRREKVFPGFIFATQPGEGLDKLMVLEMKGKHLAGNDDTTYKQAVLKLMTEAFEIETTAKVGELELVIQEGTAANAIWC